MGVEREHDGVLNLKARCLDSALRETWVRTLRYKLSHKQSLNYAVAAAVGHSAKAC